MSAAETPARDFAVLVNPDRIRSSIKRLFSNNVGEIIGELLQNSQRARAARVSITTRRGGFTYADDGHGVLGGAVGFHTLLSFGDSSFDNPTVDDQDPMGIGTASLLSSNLVCAVTFSSGGYSIRVETARWWTEPAYYQSWLDRLEQSHDPETGIRIDVECDDKLVQQLRYVCGQEPTGSQFFHLTGNHPAEGYDDLLEITFDGAPVKTGVPPHRRLDDAQIVTTYEGCELRILLGTRRSSFVNWYGQVIDSGHKHEISFYLHVRAGRPVNPKSPSRSGLIEDDRRAALIDFVKSSVFDFLFHPDNKEKIRADWVLSYYDLDPERARREAPYFVASLLKPVVRAESNSDLHPASVAELHTYDDPPTLVAKYPSVVLPEPDEDEPYPDADEYCSAGLHTLLQATGPVYSLDKGDETRLAVRTLWWRPGAETCNFQTETQEEGVMRIFEPGHWGLGTQDEQPSEWHPIEGAHVLLLSGRDGWDPRNVHWAVGANDLESFLREFGWAAFSPDDNDYDAELLTAAYDDALAALLRSLRGRCVPRTAILSEIIETGRRAMRDRAPRITDIRITYRKSEGEEGNKQSREIPDTLVLTNSAGDSVTLTLTR